MKQITDRSSLRCGFALVLLVVANSAATAVAADRVFEDVNIVRPELNRIDRAQSVVIRDGRIAAVG
ncbi:MAG: hypothetical protein KJO13_03710, partial [Gammaproteobacteria bacterium]|nr:hypothetical protein [Gammaproteobacteria bacterium]